MNTPANAADTTAATLPARRRAHSSGSTAAHASTGATVWDTDAAGQ